MLVCNTHHPTCHALSQAAVECSGPCTALGLVSAAMGTPVPVSGASAFGRQAAEKDSTILPYICLYIAVDTVAIVAGLL